MQPIGFYHHHLEQVSRSFSFCIMQLESPAKEWIALSYLLCRIVDTIEDSIWPDQQSQHQAFQELKLFLEVSPSAEQFEAWLHRFPTQIVSAEQHLLADLPWLLRDKKELPSEIQQQLFNTMSQMMAGMSYFMKQYQKQGRLTLPSLTTTNQYCFFVAGIVGELLTRIYTYLIPEFKWTEPLLIQSFHFGLFLQKINILKDQVSDELAGRCYIDSRDSLRDSLVVNARVSLDYLKSIPIISGRTYRLFCAWSLFIGLASLKWIDKSWKTQKFHKIGRRETAFLMSQVKQMIDDNYALELLFQRYLPSNSFFLETQPRHGTEHTLRPTWFVEIYPYEFSEKDIAVLGI